MRRKDVFIIILHFGKEITTRSCIISLYANETYPFHIIIVNNTQKKLKERIFKMKEINIIENKVNVGFAKGVNIGINEAMKMGANYFMLLNNDTYIPKPFLKELVNTVNINKSFGIAAPAIFYNKKGKKTVDLGGYVSKFTGRTSHREISIITDTNILYPQYVSGCCMLIKKKVIQKIGIFDELFFLYYEDVDYCLRSKKENYTCVLNPKCVILHELSKSVGKSSPFTVYHQMRSAVLFGSKYFNNWYERFFHTSFILVQSLLFIKMDYHNTSICIKAIIDARKQIKHKSFHI